jgi:hypothetical protein
MADTHRLTPGTHRLTPGTRLGPVVSAAALVVAAAATCGCLVVSLQPFYEQGTIQFEERLLGTWLNAEDGVTVNVSRGPWNSYKVVYQEGTRDSVFTAYHTRIGGASFLDLCAETGVETSPVLVPAHSLFRIEVADKSLKVSGLSYDWFMSATERNSLVALSYGVDANRNLVLTSPTRTVREWVAAHLKQGEVFGEPVTLTRKE